MLPLIVVYVFVLILGNTNIGTNVDTGISIKQCYIITNINIGNELVLMNPPGVGPGSKRH